MLPMVEFCFPVLFILFFKTSIVKYWLISYFKYYADRL